MWRKDLPKHRMGHHSCVATEISCLPLHSSDPVYSQEFSRASVHQDECFGTPFAEQLKCSKSTLVHPETNQNNHFRWRMFTCSSSVCLGLRPKHTHVGGDVWHNTQAALRQHGWSCQGRGSWFSSCVIVSFSQYAWQAPNNGGNCFSASWRHAIPLLHELAPSYPLAPFSQRIYSLFSVFFVTFLWCRLPFFSF